ncbi:hypothetical protein DPMN_046545 [Dreissena polymorpha]|uniref:Uncharacterized protein n=1 Tax=Dreissena polymorpha TaxID=45954 RepID=A0A9D4HY98_DREPO|nr:hypothetical protein DPMN_046545 [Dreissena polymorpha]
MFCIPVMNHHSKERQLCVEIEPRITLDPTGSLRRLRRWTKFYDWPTIYSYLTEESGYSRCITIADLMEESGDGRCITIETQNKSNEINHGYFFRVPDDSHYRPMLKIPTRPEAFFDPPRIRDNSQPDYKNSGSNNDGCGLQESNLVRLQLSPHGEIHKIVRELMSLSFVPVEEIEPVLHSRFGSLTDERLLQLRKHIFDQWVNSMTLPPL